MLKRVLVAALLLPLATLGFADPNPGGDNPGTTYITIPFAFGDTGDGSADCFAEADFCAEVLQDPLVPSFDGLKGKQRRQAAALAADYAALACATASSTAAAAYEWYFFGGGTLELARHGNHGAMHHITFNAALESGTMTFAAAGAEAGADASAGAVTSAEVSSMEELCTVVFADPELPEEHPAVQLCLDWEANASAYADAYATAGAFAASSALSESGSFGAVSNYTEVWAANIEKFVSVATTAAGSFSYADASAVADVFADAFAYAYAQAFIEACAELNDGGDEIYAQICSDGWDDVDSAYAQAYAGAYAEAQAEAWAATLVAAILPATYVNENGIYDTISFGPEAAAIAGGDVAVSCGAMAEATAEGGDEPPAP